MVTATEYPVPDPQGISQENNLQTRLGQNDRFVALLTKELTI